MVYSLATHHSVQDHPPVAKKMKMQIVTIPREILDDLQYNLIDVKLLQKSVLDRSDFILLNSYSRNEEKVEILMELMRKKTEEEHNKFLEIMEEDYKWLRDKCEIFLQQIRLEALRNGLNIQSVHAPAGEDPADDRKDPDSIEEIDRSSQEIKSPSSPDSTVIHRRLKSEDSIIPKLSSDAKIMVKEEEKENAKLHQSLSAEMMTIVRRNHRVVRKWSTLAHVLGMTAIVHTLRMRMLMNGEDTDACVLHLLDEWKGAHPKEASLGKLISVLREEDFNDVADELEEKFAT